MKLNFLGEKNTVIWPVSSVHVISCPLKLSITKATGSFVQDLILGTRAFSHQCRYTAEFSHEFAWLMYGRGGRESRKQCGVLEDPTISGGTFLVPVAFTQKMIVTRSFAVRALIPLTSRRFSELTKYVLAGKALKNRPLSSMLKMFSGL